MHKEVQVEKQGDAFHIVCRDFMGPYEAKKIAERLGLRAIKPPANGPQGNGLEPGQFYMSDGMSRHPELHALVNADKLEEVARMAHDFHMVVTAGSDLLPEVTAPEPPKDEPESYVAVIEERHKSIIQRGPKALIQAILVRAVPGVVVLGLVVILFRHIGDHRQDVTLETMFIRAAKPPVEQSFWQRLISPDHSHSVRHQIRGVRFLDGNRMIFMDGNFVRVEGVDDLRPLFDQARKQSVAPEIDATIADGRILIDAITCGDETFMQDGELVRIAKFGPTDNEPRRGPMKGGGTFQEFRELPYDQAELLKPLEGSRIAVVGRIVDEDGRRVLRTEGGAGVVLNVASYLKTLNLFIETFTGDPAKLQVDMVFKELYPWTNTREPAESRKETKIIGEADVYSASAHNFHVIGRR